MNGYIDEYTDLKEKMGKTKKKKMKEEMRRKKIE